MGHSVGGAGQGLLQGTLDLVALLAGELGVDVSRTVVRPTALLAYGRRGERDVVLKVARQRGASDESRSGEALEAFAGAAVVTVLEHRPGAQLLEHITPATQLVSLVRDGRDDDATDVLADVIGSMSSPRPASGFPTPLEWSRSFERYLASGDQRIAPALVARAQRMYVELHASQQRVRLLHGDLHHYNVVLDARRGWLAIDPKGFVAEVEYELGACLRNPVESPEFVSTPDVVRRRVGRFAARLALNETRILAWAFSQAVLSAIWSIEDEGQVDLDGAALLLARTIAVMLT